MGSQTFNSGSGTWSPPDGVNSITVIVRGGGGGGGGVNNGIGGAGGGGGGGCCVKVVDCTNYRSFSYSVGGGGAGGNATNGAAGGNSTFSGDVISMTANGGSYGLVAQYLQFSSGGSGGTATGGDNNYTGTNGQDGFAADVTTWHGGDGGQGANSGGAGGTGGYGDATLENEATPTNGIAPGGGGGGAGEDNPYGYSLGGDGAVGQIYITWTEPLQKNFGYIIY